MRHLQPDELERLQETQDGAMMDLCIILQHVDGATDDYGKPVEVYQPGQPQICGFDAAARKEVMDGAQAAITDAQMRLPIGTVISNLDRVQVTHRHGVELSDQPVFGLLGIPRRGTSGLLLNLRSIV